MVTVSIHELDIADCTKWATEFQNAVFSRPKFISDLKPWPSGANCVARGVARVGPHFPKSYLLAYMSLRFLAS